MNKYLLTLIGTNNYIDRIFQCVVETNCDIDEEYNRLKTDADIDNFCRVFYSVFKKQIDDYAPEHLKPITSCRILYWRNISDIQQLMKNCAKSEK